MDLKDLQKKIRFRSVLESRQNVVDVVLLFLALCQPTKSAYRIVSMRDACSLGTTDRQEIRLTATGYNSAASIIFDAKYREFEPETCAIDFVTVNTHVISLHLAVATPPTAATSQENSKGGRATIRKYRQPCPLSLFSAGKNGKLNRLLQSVDLCSGDVVTLTELYSRHHLTVTWTPPRSNFSDQIKASELVVTAVGIGPTLCKKHANAMHVYFPCRHLHGRPASYCVATELLCDGRRNCPVGGEDEDVELCDVRLPLVEWSTVFQNATVRRDRQNKGTSGQVSAVVPSVLGNGTRNSTVTRGGKNSHKRIRQTFPEALAHYGPWGYLMLGMLISGSVLVVCGIWECCCRDHKQVRSTPPPSPSSSPPPTDVFVITPGVPGDEATSPPAYDDLEQPPLYCILFPVSGKQEVPVVPVAAEDH